MFAEMVCYFESKGTSVYDVLQDIYKNSATTWKRQSQ